MVPHWKEIHLNVYDKKTLILFIYISASSIVLLAHAPGALANDFSTPVPPEIDPPNCAGTVTGSETAIDSGASFFLTAVGECRCFDLRDYDAGREHFINAVRRDRRGIPCFFVVKTKGMQRIGPVVVGGGGGSGGGVTSTTTLAPGKLEIYRKKYFSSPFLPAAIADRSSNTPSCCCWGGRIFCSRPRRPCSSKWY